MTITSKELIGNFTDYEVIESWFLSPISPISYVMLLNRKDTSFDEEIDYILIRMTEGEQDLMILHIGSQDECYLMADRAYGFEPSESSEVIWGTTSSTHSHLPSHSHKTTPVSYGVKTIQFNTPPHPKTHQPKYVDIHKKEKLISDKFKSYFANLFGWQK